MSRFSPIFPPENDGPVTGDTYTCKRTGATYEWYAERGCWNRVETSDHLTVNVTREEGPSDESKGRGELSDVGAALRDLAILIQGLKQFNPDTDRISIRVLRKGIWMSRVPRSFSASRTPIRSRFVAWNRAGDFEHLCAKLKELLYGV